MPRRSHPPVAAVAAVVALALAATACGSRPDEGTVPVAATAAGAPVEPATPDTVGADLLTLDPATLPVPEPSPEAVAAAPVPETVDVFEPAVIVRAPEVPAEAVSLAAVAEGVTHVAAVATLPLTAPAPEGEPRALEALVVDPASFRALTPEVTAQAPGVWQRLTEGDVVVRHDVANELGLELGGPIELTGPGGTFTLRVGAFASNGAPPLGDLVVPWTVGLDLGASAPTALVVAVEESADAEDTGSELAELVGEAAELEVRTAPEERTAQLRGSSVRFEPFSYTELGDGMIAIDKAWVRRWIAPVEIPGIATTYCHRMMIPQLQAALSEIQAAGLYGHFEKDQFGGCYVPRHIDWNPSRPLSMHAWGLAIDFNTRDNWLGQTPMMDMRIVSIFEKWGFDWGGRWSRPDGMHFELARVVEVR